MLVGAIDFHAQGTSVEVAERVARDAARYPRESSRCFHSDQQISMFVIEREEGKPELTAWQDNQKRSWLVGDLNYTHTAGWQACDPSRLAASVAEGVPGRWILVEVDTQANTLRLTTDRFGLMWLYIAKTASGFVFSTDFAALARGLKGTLSVDSDTVLLELVLGYTPDDRTIFKEIQLAPAGQTIELSVAGVTVVSEQPIVYGDRYASLSQQQKFARLDEIYARIAARFFKPIETRMVLSISAGYDSRYALALLKKSAIKVPLCTFGDSGSDEVRGAAAIVAKVGQSTDVFSIPLADWQQWRRSIQSLGNAGMTQWSGWAESWLTFLCERGDFAVIGYLGDALTGKHLGNHPSPPDWLDHWMRWSMDDSWASSRILHETARQQLNDVMRTRFRHRLDGAQFAFPHQQALHLDLYGRQRRWVASQPQLMSRFLSPVLYFYDHELIDFWTNLPPQDLIHQSLYLSYAQARFPVLFHRGEGQAPAPLTRAMRKVARMLRGTDRTRRPPVIDHQNIIGPNKDRILELAESVAPLLEPILDIKRYSDGVRNYGSASASLPSDLIMRGVNIMFLLELSL